MIPKFNQEARERRENNKKVGERRENNHCRNCGGKNFFFFPHNFGNAIAEIVGEKFFFFPHNFGNAIDENVGKKKKELGKKIFPIWIMAIALSKM